MNESPVGRQAELQVMSQVKIKEPISRRRECESSGDTGQSAWRLALPRPSEHTHYTPHTYTMLSCFVNISICCFPEVDSNTMKALFTHLFYYHVTRDSERGIGIAIPSVVRLSLCLLPLHTYIRALLKWWQNASSWQ